MKSESLDLKEQINAKREELNQQIENGRIEETLEKSKELDELIVEYTKENEKV